MVWIKYAINFFRFFQYNSVLFLGIFFVFMIIQDHVRTSLELLRNAGIKIWMLTGDKMETALCIAKSSGLFSKTDSVHLFKQVETRTEVHKELSALRRFFLRTLYHIISFFVICQCYFDFEIKFGIK